MMPRLADWCLPIAFAGILVGCRGSDRRSADSAGSLPPVYPSGPVANTNWNPDAGPLMIVSSGSGNDTVGVVLPEATDSTIESLHPSPGSRLIYLGEVAKPHRPLLLHLFCRQIRPRDVFRGRLED